MSENQKDQRNQQSGSSSNQKTPDGKNKTTDPNKSTTNLGTHQGSQGGNQSGNQQRQASTFSEGKSKSDLKESKDQDENSKDKVTGSEWRPKDSDSEGEEHGNQNPKRRDL